jgi:hypothetical protein
LYASSTTKERPGVTDTDAEEAEGEEGDGLEGVVEHGAEGIADVGEAIYDGVTDPAPGESEESPLVPLGEAQDQFEDMVGDDVEGLAEGEE